MFLLFFISCAVKVEIFYYLSIKKRFITDFQMDVWSFGVVIWETLTRVRPYEGLNDFQIFQAVASGFDTENLSCFLFNEYSK